MKALLVFGVCLLVGYRLWRRREARYEPDLVERHRNAYKIPNAAIYRGDV